MPKLDFSLKHPDLFHKIISIVKKHEDDFKTTQLIMKEIEKWQEGVSRLTPLCASIILGEPEKTDKKILGGDIKKDNRYGYLETHQGTILGDDNAGEETFYDFKRPKK